MRPRILINFAMSLDGKVSSKTFEPVTFTSREDKHLLMEIRSRCDALVVGARTAIDYQNMGIADPKLCAKRLSRGQTKHPLRVIVSGNLNLSPDLQVFKNPISPIVIVCCESAPRSRRLRFSKFGHLLVCGRRKVDIPRLISILGREYHIKTIVCEGGPTLSDAFFRARVVDELYLTLCPRIVGGKTAPTLAEGIGFPNLKSAVRARLVDCRKGDTEWFLHYRFGSV